LKTVAPLPIVKRIEEDRHGTARERIACRQRSRSQVESAGFDEVDREVIARVVFEHAGRELVVMRDPSHTSGAQFVRTKAPLGVFLMG
jgi:hypothetical protein